MAGLGVTLALLYSEAVFFSVCQRRPPVMSNSRLLLSQRQSLAILGPLFVMINLAAATVADALTLLSRHLHSHSTLLHLVARPVPEGLLIEYDVSFREQVSDRQVVELGFGLIASFVRSHQPGDWMPAFVQLRHGRPPSTLVRQRLLGPNVYFDQDRNALCLDAAALARPVGASAIRAPGRRTTADCGATYCRHRYRCPGGRGRAGVDPRTIQLHCSRGGPAYGRIDPVPAALPGTGGTRFEEIRDGVRADLAGKYLRQTTMSVAEVAVILGYSQSSPFTRFFRRHFGTTPLEYRRNGGSRV